jgi:integrative and conjugative element protein (TIGR02256 family)
VVGPLPMKTPIHSTWQSSCSRYSVDLNQDCVDAMIRLAREHYPEEVGTALVGSYSDDGFRAQVTGLAPLTDDSRGGRSRFYRGAQGLRDFFDRLFRGSRGLVHYVGEWHSHPDGPPHPSGTDMATALDIARDTRARCAECILIIVAISSKRESLGVVVGSRQNGTIQLEQLRIAEHE